VKKIAIVGAGSCGTALAMALSLSRRPHRISLWVHGADVLEALRARHENSIYLPGMRVPDGVAITGAVGEALEDADIVLGAMPAAHARAVYGSMVRYLQSAACAGLPDRSAAQDAGGAARDAGVTSHDASAGSHDASATAHRASAQDPAVSRRDNVDPGRDIIFVSATKGIEPGSLKRMTEVAGEVLAPVFTDSRGSPRGLRLAALSGPSFALEVARGDPTAVVIASADAGVAASVQEEFSGPTLRLYTNDDVIGTELGGAVKNVIAIAAGVCAGLGLGSNSMASLVTRGLAEMTRLAIALGGRRDTLAGLAGLGDLILTATGTLSRNRAVGVQLGQGRRLADILGGMRMVAEGVGTTAATLALGQRHGIEMPITEQMHAVLDQGREPRDAMRELMERRLKQE
jgi:glycerol-3-phosphate dehydrogenase (NAD(P)+)